MVNVVAALMGALWVALVVYVLSDGHITARRVGGLYHWRVGRLGGSFYWARTMPARKSEGE